MGKTAVCNHPCAFWRATFDNLDFRMKFAKSISTGRHLKRTLHLLKSQVTYRKCTSNITTENREQIKLSKQLFDIEHENSEWLKYDTATFDAMVAGAN